MTTRRVAAGDVLVVNTQQINSMGKPELILYKDDVLVVVRVDYYFTYMSTSRGKIAVEVSGMISDPNYYRFLS